MVLADLHATEMLHWISSLAQCAPPPGLRNISIMSIWTRRHPLPVAYPTHFSAAAACTLLTTHKFAPGKMQFLQSLDVLDPDSSIAGITHRREPFPYAKQAVEASCPRHSVTVRRSIVGFKLGIGVSLANTKRHINSAIVPYIESWMPSRIEPVKMGMGLTMIG